MVDGCEPTDTTTAAAAVAVAISSPHPFATVTTNTVDTTQFVIITATTTNTTTSNDVVPIVHSILLHTLRVYSIIPTTNKISNPTTEVVILEHKWME